ncbi:YqiA/YcfP family alpha/beta fold hydrolase [Polaribacter sp. Asnod1-A03]|uniref:YqiA/YcfP family alpha/beta fold hydrolase n=1 Tax=Polaribacter sp. Asnod1-A03 TaxID=3160581 RepID=UPI00386FA815
MKFIYIHGLNSSKESNKYKILQEKFGDTISIFEWCPEEKDIVKRLKKLTLKIKDSIDEVTIIGDSTGCNFSLQLRKMLNDYGVFTRCVLISPLLSLRQLNDLSIFNKTLEKQIIDFSYFKETLILKPLHDELLSYNFNDFIINNNLIINCNTTHRFPILKNHIIDIKNYIKSIYL